MVGLGVVAAVALPFALVAGLAVGAQPSGGAQVVALDADVAAGTPMVMPFPAADRVEPRPVVMPVVPAAQKMTIGVSGTTPSASGTYGVGVLPTIRFDAFVPEAARWKVQENLEVLVTPKLAEPLVWSWLDGQTLALRPEGFWPAKHSVSIRSTWSTKRPLVRVSPADWSKKRPVPPQKMTDIRMRGDVRMDFRIGREQILTIDADSYSGVVTRKGEKVLEVPVSLGKSGWETASGIKTLMEFYEVKRLQNTTGPETWSVDAPYSIRLTWSGEFLHSATWNGAIGSAHTSHGCTNLTLSDAQWFYENGLRGDPVVTKNTGMGYRGAWDGDGAPWNVGWKTWKAQSAVAP